MFMHQALEQLTRVSQKWIARGDKDQSDRKELADAVEDAREALAKHNIDVPRLKEPSFVYEDGMYIDTETGLKRDQYLSDLS